MNSRGYQSGFTAIELLITLFIAIIFLLTGYQLYGLVIYDSGQTRAQTRASNVAYDYLRHYSNSGATSPCTVSTPVNAASIAISGLSAATVTVTISCPYSSATAVSKVDVVVLYNALQQKVEYATYVSK